MLYGHQGYQDIKTVKTQLSRTLPWISQHTFCLLKAPLKACCTYKNVMAQNCLVVVLGEDKSDFGILTDDDHLWKKNKREKQRHQIKRAEKFLETLFDNAEEQVIIVVTHSGFIRSLLLGVDREPYRPRNAEVVPAIIQRRNR